MLFEIDNSDELSRKARERLFKRREIISASVDLFAQKGFKVTTLDDIAEKSEFGKGTIYNYFANKEEIFVAIIEEVSKKFLREVEEIYNDEISVKEFFTKLTLRFFELYEKHSHMFILMFRIRAEFESMISHKSTESLQCYQTETNDLYRKVIERGIKNGEIKDIDTDSLLVFYRSVFFPFIHGLTLFKKDKFSPAMETKFIVDLIFNGISK